MEDEKKKKKNKKKKNKQHKASEGPAVGVGEEIASLDENHLSTQTHGNQESIADVQNRDVQKENVDLNGHCANGTDSSILVEAEKQKWLQREASLQERIKQLENDKELHTQKESILAEADKKQWLKREATLEERIKQLQDENDLHMQKEAGLEMRIVQLQTEKHSWIQKEATLEGKIQQLLDENSTLSVKWASLEEKVEHQERERNSWVLKENSSREIISSLNDENRKLQGQVMELEEFRINILQENQLLKEKVSSLQLQIKELEESVSSAHASTEITKHASKHVDLNPQTEAATVLIEKLTSENADLVEKVNELYIELDQLRVAAGLSSAIGLDKKIGALQNSNVADHMSEPTDNSSASSERMESVEAVPIHGQSSQEAVPMHDENSQEAVPIHDQRSLEAVPMLDESSQEAVPIHDQRSIEAVPINDKSPLEAVPMNDERISADIEDVEQTAVIPNSSETDDSGEIVQIPLDENEARELELQAAENDRNTTVPITDAPLIGAPFRFISFVAKYVSGADLVGKSSTNPTVQP
uniref:Uncharacterized protein n=1 Tax=Vitis vinifera TaxID=29760 RepID=F6HQU0_VITVI|eukprot:XP_002279159.3 PREDICTED: flagellar attachment zone protein 1 isoform X1 [Vitis vinifera]